MEEHKSEKDWSLFKTLWSAVTTIMEVFCLTNMLMTHPSAVLLIPITWPRLCRKTLWSAVLKTVLRSSRTSIETSPSTAPLRRSFVTLTSSAMGSKTWLKHGKHGSSDCSCAGSQACHLDDDENAPTADCYHVDELKLTELLITGQMRDALFKWQGHTVSAKHLIVCPVLRSKCFLMSRLSQRPSSMALLPHTLPPGLSVTPNLSVVAENLSATSGRKDNGYVGGSMFDSYRLSSEAWPRWFGSAAKICAVGLFFFPSLLHMTHSLS